jgi:hypothetical protein
MIRNRLRAFHEEHPPAVVKPVVRSPQVRESGGLKAVSLNGPEFLLEEQAGNVF